ncbi:hypothetical protein B0H19DRAFT_155491 [Mycena capillaripes]|nr:hypothetical protein B0H19DRAFT_155491 [Mycena capillaripes]
MRYTTVCGNSHEPSFGIDIGETVLPSRSRVEYKPPGRPRSLVLLLDDIAESRWDSTEGELKSKRRGKELVSRPPPRPPTAAASTLQSALLCGGRRRKCLRVRVRLTKCGCRGRRVSLGIHCRCGCRVRGRGCRHSDRLALALFRFGYLIQCGSAEPEADPEEEDVPELKGWKAEHATASALDGGGSDGCGFGRECSAQT